jgi:predicted RecB family endonuclease
VVHVVPATGVTKKDILFESALSLIQIQGITMILKVVLVALENQPLLEVLEEDLEADLVELMMLTDQLEEVDLEDVDVVEEEEEAVVAAENSTEEVVMTRVQSRHLTKKTALDLTIGEILLTILLQVKNKVKCLHLKIQRKVQLMRK